MYCTWILLLTTIALLQPLLVNLQQTLFTAGVPYLIQNTASSYLLFVPDVELSLTNLRHFWYLDPLSKENHYLLRSADPTLFPTAAVTCEIRVFVENYQSANGDEQLYQIHPVSCNGSVSTKARQFVFISTTTKTVCVRSANEDFFQYSFYNVTQIKKLILDMQDIPVQMTFRDAKEGSLPIDKSKYQVFMDFGVVNGTFNGREFSIAQIHIPLKQRGKEELPLKLVVNNGGKGFIKVAKEGKLREERRRKYCLEIDVITGSGVYHLKMFQMDGHEGHFGCLLDKQELTTILLQKMIQAGNRVYYNEERGIFTFPKRTVEEVKAEIVGKEVPVGLHEIVGGVGLAVGMTILLIVGYVLYVRKEED